MQVARKEIFESDFTAEQLASILAAGKEIRAGRAVGYTIEEVQAGVKTLAEKCRGARV